MDNTEEEAFEAIAKAYSIGDRIYETDEEDVVILLIKASKAFALLQELRLYKEQ